MVQKLTDTPFCSNLGGRLTHRRQLVYRRFGQAFRSACHPAFALEVCHWQKTIWYTCRSS